MPSITVGELHFGARKSSRAEANIARVDVLAETSEILACDAGTAWRYGLVKNGLKLAGKLVPENDIWITALALQHGLTLATRDAHFNAIEGSAVDAW